MKFARWAILALLVAVAVPASSQTAKPLPAAPGAGTPAQAPAASRATRAGAQQVDGIAAVVNDDVVLKSDVEEQLYLFLMRSQAQPDSEAVDTLRRQVLDELINEKLIVAEAKRQAITVGEAEVNKEVDKALDDARQRLGEDGFRQQLARENLTEEQLRGRYREDARRQMIAQRLVQKSLPRKPVTQAEAEAYFKEHPDKFPPAPAQVQLSVIQIPATPDSAAEAAAKAKILAIRKRITGGERFAKVAAEVSEDPGSARAGGDLGFFGRGSMEPAFEKVAFTLKPGELSEPVKTPFGWHLIEVMERDTARTMAGKDSLDAEGKPALEVHARHILVRVELTKADADRAQALAEKVQSEAAKGMDFATLAHRYSHYEGPASPDGDIGFVSVATLQPQIKAGLDTLEIGQVSAVLPNQVGFNIFKLTDRKAERPYTLEEIRQELPDAVQQIQYRERYDAWVKGLRAKAQIEIRSS